jgi:hypothetical protein
MVDQKIEILARRPALFYIAGGIDVAGVVQLHQGEEAGCGG